MLVRYFIRKLRMSSEDSVDYRQSEISEDCPRYADCEIEDRLSELPEVQDEVTSSPDELFAEKTELLKPLKSGTISQEAYDLGKKRYVWLNEEFIQLRKAQWDIKERLKLDKQAMISYRRMTGRTKVMRLILRRQYRDFKNNKVVEI